ININGGNGESVLHVAARSIAIWEKKKEKASISDEPKLTIFDIESSPEVPPIVHKMLELGADVNDIDDESRTPLHIAAQFNRYDYVLELVARGANLRVNINKINSEI
ncbi:unnamed protein product, partial [Rotaria sp. Silwood1]